MPANALRDLTSTSRLGSLGSHSSLSHLAACDKPSSGAEFDPLSPQAEEKCGQSTTCVPSEPTSAQESLASASQASSSQGNLKAHILHSFTASYGTTVWGFVNCLCTSGMYRGTSMSHYQVKMLDNRPNTFQESLDCALV